MPYYNIMADISEHVPVQLWRGADLIQDVLYMRDEIHPESRPLLLVSIECVVELGPRFRP